MLTKLIVIARTHYFKQQIAMLAGEGLIVDEHLSQPTLWGMQKKLIQTG